MKQIANNDIEELHKEGMQYARLSLEIQIMIYNSCGCPLQLRHLRTACPKEFWKAVISV
jgi:hypothetical protein